MKDVFGLVFTVLAVPVCLGLMVWFWLFILKDANLNLFPAVSLLLFLLPLVLPVALFHLTYDRWGDFTHTMNKYQNGRATIRLKLPAEVFKSPEAMETVLRQIHNTSKADNLMQAYFDGKHSLWNSFEIVSIGGEVRFYINVPRKKMKDLVETQLYAQYPGIEVEHEVVDYAAEIQWDEDKMDLMSFHIVKPEDEVLPIKTYLDYGMDRLPKEEEKMDPITPMIEFLGTAKPHERIIYQIIAEPHVKKNFSLGTSLREKPTWNAAAKQKINEIMGRDENRMSKKSEDEEDQDSRPMLTMGEKDLITAIERNTSKLAYTVGIRAMYITLDKDKFNPDMITGLLKSFYPFDDEYRNKIATRWKTDFDYKFFEDFSGTRKTARKKTELEHFKRRVYDPGTGKQAAGHAPKVMSVEELATIFHIPGSVALTPGLARIPSNTTTAPSNLPIEIQQ